MTVDLLMFIRFCPWALSTHIFYHGQGYRREKREKAGAKLDQNQRKTSVKLDVLSGQAMPFVIY
jgi:hypothetical protein